MSIEFIPLLFFLGLFSLSVTFVEYFTRSGKLQPESARKLVHVSGGLGSLLFPFFIFKWQTVFLLAVLFSVTLFIGERRALLKSLSNVGRKSFGAVLFPVAILVLFVVAEGRIWLYVSALLVLTLADTGAALVGTHYGKMLYQTGPREAKSLEGSFSFWLIGFLAVHLPLLLLSDLPRETTVLVGVLMATLLCGIEAISVRGTDNILVPVTTIYVLLKITTKAPLEVLFQNISLITITIVILILNKSKRLMEIRPLILIILISFAAWSLGSAEWIIPVASGVVTHAVIFRSFKPLVDNFSVRKLIWPLIPSMVVLFIANKTMNHNFWFGTFTITTTTAVSLYLMDHLRSDSNIKLPFLNIIELMFFPLFFTYMLLWGFEGILVMVLMAISMLITVAVVIIYNHSSRFKNSKRISIFAAAAGLSFLLLQLAGFLPEMDPVTWNEVFK